MAKRNPAREDSFNFLAEVIEKMIDAQISNAESIASIKDGMAHTHDAIESIKGHFTNGFRSEIKKHVTEEVSKCIEQIDTASVKAIEQISTAAAAASNAHQVVNEIKLSLSKPSFWLKMFVGLIISIGSITGAVLAVTSLIHPQSANGSSSLSASTGDVNGDGISDIVVKNENGTISVILGKGNGVFIRAEEQSLNSNHP